MSTMSFPVVLRPLALVLALCALTPLPGCYVESGPGYLGAGFIDPRPEGPPDHYVWVPAGPGVPRGYWSYVGPARPGWVWTPGHTRPDGTWVPPHWSRQ